MSFGKIFKTITVGGLIALSALVNAQKADGSLIVNYNPDQIGTVSAPVVGLGGTSSDYLLTNPFGTSTLDRSFDGNNQEMPGIDNPSTAQDAASFDDNYMFQLSTTDGIRKVDLTTGEQILINGKLGIMAGANSFGIGYDPVSNSIGIGRFDGTTMSFSRYDIDTDNLTQLASFGFDTSKYGTPSGLDFVDKNGNLRMLVGTRDGSGEDMFSGNRNFILDMNALTGSIDQYATTPGSTNKLQDLLYENGRLAVGHQRSGTGYMTVGDFDVIPEPSTLLLLGIGALTAASVYRKRKE